MPAYTLSNPNNTEDYTLNPAGEPMCDHCGRPMHQAYMHTPNLRCDGCHQLLKDPAKHVTAKAATKAAATETKP